MKIAIVHDWLANYGGAERIIEILHNMYPDAPIYTLVFNPARLPKVFGTMDIRTTFVQWLPFGKSKYQAYLPLMPLAFEQLNLTEYDLVISSSSSCAKGVITRADTLHICYCNTPMRYAWDFYFEYTDKMNWITKPITALFLHRMRQWDRLSADRVDYFIANSNNVAKRINKHYRRSAVTIYPPVQTSYYLPKDEDKGYYLIVSRLVSYKRIDLAIQAFNILGLPLKIIGSGSEFSKLNKMAKCNIEFLGKLPDAETKEYYAYCKAFVFPGEEDFGITPLEAQSCGRPVIAYRKGGVLETVDDNVTGIFFNEQSVESLIEAVERFEKNFRSFNKVNIRSNALKFDEAVFKESIYNYIQEKYNQTRNKMI